MRSFQFVKYIYIYILHGEIFDFYAKKKEKILRLLKISIYSTIRNYRKKKGKEKK